MWQVEYFSSSEYRRSSVGEKISPSFFDPTNQEAWHQRCARAISQPIDSWASISVSSTWFRLCCCCWCAGRDVIARQVLDDAIEALKSSIDIAIFDAANITRGRRKRIIDRMTGEELYGQVRGSRTAPTAPSRLPGRAGDVTWTVMTCAHR